MLLNREQYDIKMNIVCDTSDVSLFPFKQTWLNMVECDPKHQANCQHLFFFVFFTKTKAKLNRHQLYQTDLTSFQYWYKKTGTD